MGKGKRNGKGSDNKLLFGFDNVHYAVYDEASDTYDAPVLLGSGLTGAGAVSFSLKPEGDKAQFFANNTLFHTQTQDNGLSGDLMMSKFPAQYLVDTLGWVYDEAGMLIEAANVPQKPHALLFEVMGTESPVRVVLYNCRGSKPTRDYKTNESSPKFDGETMEVTATPRSFGWVTTAKASLVRDENPAAFDSFFKTVMLPEEPAKLGAGKPGETP